MIHFPSRWFRPASDTRSNRRADRNRLAIEVLEDRAVPSTFSVTNLGDGIPGSLRHAIAAASASAGPDEIRFADGLSGTIVLTGGQLTLTSSLRIDGPGAGVITVSGAQASRVFKITPAVEEVVISGLTIAGGRAVRGGGIDNAGTLTLNNATVGGNSAAHEGGGISNSGTLILNNSTVGGNTAVGGLGGGVWNSGTAVVTASTFIGNYADRSGGGLYSLGTLTLSDSTVSGNTVADHRGFGGGIGAEGTSVTTIASSTIAGNAGQFGGVFTAFTGYAGTLHARNTIIAGNGVDLAGDLGSRGHNLIGNPSSGSGFHPTDLLNVDPQLGPLQDNGGPTWTRAPLPGSPAINAGDPAAAGDYDQRGPGFARVVGGRIDIGAYEVQAVPAVVGVTVNGGAAQRSRVAEVAVAFDGEVDSAVLASAFTLTRASDGATVGSVAVATRVIAGRTVATLTFSGSNTEFGSLADGRWVLSLDWAEVEAPAGVAVAADFAFALHRLFGDSDGDDDVDNGDLWQFRLAFGRASGQAGYAAHLDADADGDVDDDDLLQFRPRFGTRV